MQADHVLPQFSDTALTVDILGCVSSIDLIKKTAFWEDDSGIIYRPRKKLTIDANRGIDDVDICEKIIYFDFYIKKRHDLEVKHLAKGGKKNTRYKVPNKLRPGEKGQIPEIGQTIKFYSRYKPAEGALESWKGIVENIYSGTITLQNEKNDLETDFNDNVGLIRIKVLNPGTIEQSLRYPPENKRKRIRAVYAS